MPNTVYINNQLNQNLDIYTFTVPSGASVSNPETMYPIYTKVGTVNANDPKATYIPSADNPLENLSFAIQTTGLPVCNAVTNILGDTNIVIGTDAITNAQAAFGFYQSYKGSPYSPAALQINGIILDNTDLTQQQSLLNAWFKTNNYPFDYGLFHPYPTGPKTMDVHSQAHIIAIAHRILSPPLKLYCPNNSLAKLYLTPMDQSHTNL